MKGNRITQFKWFWGWQDDKQESWLEKMSQNGLHLRDIKAFGRYVFEIDSTKSYIYRMDFDRTSGKDSDYFRLIEEAGWERVVQVLGWQYWRKDASQGQTAEIFTDNQSKIKKYNRFLTSLLAPTPAPMFIVLAMFARFPGRHPQWVVILTISLYAAWFLFLGLNIVKVIQRINTLKRMNTL
jgi:hypothetical protein